MSRYIDRDKLIDFIMESNPDWCVKPVRPIFDYINAMPTVDAVHVVRCAECVYFAEWTEYEKTRYGFRHDGMCKYWNHHSTNKNGFCDQGVRITDGYCTDGERRTE